MSKDKMTPIPWEIDDAADEINIISMKSKHNFAAIATLFCDPVDDETTANASAIVSAVNNTYGAGINPEAIPELVVALNKVLNWELPETGKFWNADETQPMSYQAAYGSEGAKEYFQKIVKAAIEKAKL